MSNISRALQKFSRIIAEGKSIWFIGILTTSIDFDNYLNSSPDMFYMYKILKVKWSLGMVEEKGECKKSNKDQENGKLVLELPLSGLYLLK